MIIDIVGYIGTALILISFTIEDMFKLRVVNSIGSIVWIVYGIGIGANPTILVNACVLCIHTYWFIKHRRKPKPKSIDKDEYGWYPDEGI